MNKPCTHCESDNTVKTEEQHLDTMRDYFCNKMETEESRTRRLRKLCGESYGAAWHIDYPSLYTTVNIQPTIELVKYTKFKFNFI